jgi:hypothetical protein
MRDRRREQNKIAKRRSRKLCTAQDGLNLLLTQNAQ